MAGNGSRDAVGLFAATARLDPRLAEYGLPINRALFAPLNRFDTAHCVMLRERGLLNAEDAAALLRVLAEVDDMGSDGFPWGDGDLWVQKERFVIGRVGEPIGGRLHTGRSRQDVGVTVQRLHYREIALDTIEALDSAIEAVIGVAERHRESVMPCYTWMQPAQPTTLGHYLTAFAYILLRRAKRLQDAFAETNRSPAGAALQGGTSHDLDRERVADLLGFDSVIRNTRDAATSYDYLSELAFGGALALTDLLRVLEDLTVWHSAEFGLVTLADEWCGTSSIMPQKRNPYPLMLIRSKGSRAVALASQSLSLLEGPTLGPASPNYLQADCESVLRETRESFELFAAFLPSARFDVVRMRELASSEWAQATDLADVLVRETGVPFRTAHHIVAAVVSEAIAARMHPNEVTATFVNDVAIRKLGHSLSISEGAVASALDVSKGIELRRGLGGTAPTEVGEQLREVREMLSESLRLSDNRRARLLDASRRLDAVAARIAGGQQ